MKLERPCRRDVLFGAALSAFAPHVQARSVPARRVGLGVPCAG
jgi:hypothetical protein